jgi:hypothetical protein
VPCDTRRLPNQSLTQRKEEIKTAVDKLNAALAAGKIKPVVGVKGGIAFPGWVEGQTGRVGDACAFRRLMSSGSALAKMAIERAETMAGRKVDRQVIGQGAHSHDGGRTWHDHKG